MTGKNNKGFSYIEMLMVLAIMAIMIGMVTFSIGLIGRTNLSRTTEKVQTLCNKARTSALTKGNTYGYLNLAEFKDGVYALVGVKVEDDDKQIIRNEGQKVCSSEFEIVTNFSGASTGVGTSDGAVHRIIYKQSTGGIIGNYDGIIIVKKKNTTKSQSFKIYGQTGKIAPNH